MFSAYVALQAHVIVISHWPKLAFIGNVIISKNEIESTDNFR